jgi:selenide,water dikinase
VHAVTDVTGYGLLGHAWEVAERSGVRIVFDAGSLPVYDGAVAVAGAGVRTGGDARNREHLAGRVVVEAPEELAAIAYDPQTSGGLLAAVAPEAVDALQDAGFVVIGAVEPGDAAVQLS